MTTPLPQAASLVVDEQKVTAYLLNTAHKDGASKASFFVKRGFSLTGWHEFAAALRAHGASHPVTDVEDTEFGRKYTVECEIVTPDGKNPCILTVWIQIGTSPPRLVTAHPNR
ncbi:MAG: hypothetical protein HY719_13440 [Planctomycetes bacterium]|nr:hypothetical protein [Planctomycetota bacterium]